VVEPVLTDHHRVIPYAPGTWGPEEANDLLTGDDTWRVPTLKEK